MEEGANIELEDFLSRRPVQRRRKRFAGKTMGIFNVIPEAKVYNAARLFHFLC